MKKTIRIAVPSVLLLTMLAGGFTIARFVRDVQGSCAENAAVAKGKYESWTADRDKFESASDKDIEEIFRKAGTGDVLSLRNLGYRYMTGTGVSKSEAKAYEVYTKSAEVGDPFGMTRLGDFYRYGMGSIEIDYQKAAEWYSKAAALNSFEATVLLSGLYGRGGGNLLADLQKSKEYALLAEKMATDSGKAGELFFLGMCFENGGSLGKDKKKAYAYYEAAALKGHCLAMLELAVAYYEGTFVDTNLDEARKWLDRAYAKGGEPEIDGLEKVAKSPALIAEIKQWYYEGTSSSSRHLFEPL